MVDGPIGDPARTPVVFVLGMLGDDRLWQLQAERLADVADPVNGGIAGSEMDLRCSGRPFDETVRLGGSIYGRLRRPGGHTGRPGPCRTSPSSPPRPGPTHPSIPTPGAG